MAPVTETFGPVVSVNVLQILAPALSAWSAFGAARLFGLRARTSFLVGLLYGFSTYDIAQNSSGHLHLSMAVFPPLVAVLLYRLVTGAVNPRRGGLLLGVAAVAQVWVSEEILATSAVVALGACLILAVRRPWEDVLAAARRLLKATGWAMLVVVPLATPALYLQFFGAGHLTSGVPVGQWSADLLTSITPTRQALLGKITSAGMMHRIQVNNYDEITGYIGLPIIVLLIASRRRIRTTNLQWCWTPLFVAAVLTLGWTVRIGGFDTHVPGPGRIVARLPVLESLLVVRFSLYVVLFAALLAGAAWDSSVTGGTAVRRWTNVLVALTVLSVFPWPSARITRLHEPPAFASGQLLPGLPEGSTIAVLPWPNTVDATAMRWQALGGMRYKLVGAWGVVAGYKGAGSYGAATPALNRLVHPHDLRTPQPTDADYLADLANLSTKASAVVVGPAGAQAHAVATLTRLLHEKPIHTGEVDIFPLRQP